MTLQGLIKNPDLMKDAEMNEILTAIKEGLNHADMKDVSKLMNHEVMKRYVQFMLARKLKNEKVIGPEKEKAIYDLYGIVEHFGSLSSGHYIALCKNLGRWIEYDDEELRLAEKIVNNNAYLLFYKRREIE